jgi:hypothetical protein
MIQRTGRKKNYRTERKEEFRGQKDVTADNGDNGDNEMIHRTERGSGG